MDESLDQMTSTSRSDPLPEQLRLLLEKLRAPGLTGAHPEFELLRRDLPAKTAILSYKQTHQESWVVFIGGTGTGKSTLFNAFCGKPLSETGVERPKTAGPVSYAHRASDLNHGFPLEGIRIVREQAPDSPARRVSGRPGELAVLDHQREEWRRLILVDTPDLDSVEIENRRMAEALVGLSDAVVFVSTQEKYADEIPNAVLARVLEAGKPSFFLLNKVHDRESGKEVVEALQGFGVTLPEGRVWMIPAIRTPEPARVSAEPSFHAFEALLLSDMTGPYARELRGKELSRIAGEIRASGARLTELLRKEDQASKEWLARLEAVRTEVSAELIETLKKRFVQESRQYLGEKVRALFARYDVLAKPRRFIREILLTPFRALGFGRGPQVPRETLRRIRKGADYRPVLRALDRMHVRVLKELSPQDPSSPLFDALREKWLPMGEQECTERLDHSLKRVEEWLEETFEELARGIHPAKKWGIYTTSVLWGILIIALEAAVGGGFSILDAAIDSTLAPFVTRGAMELFAAQEIRKIAAELGARYREGITAPLRQQHDRYLRVLQGLLPDREVAARLESLVERISNFHLRSEEG